MSKIAEEVYGALREAFPLNFILREHYVRFKGNRLFFDFYIKDMGVLVEVQGRQHTEFVKHFHGNKETFLKQKERDNLKIVYIQENKDLCLVRFYYNETVDKNLVISKIYSALERGFCE